jgi:hypothetical protein
MREVAEPSKLSDPAHGTLRLKPRRLRWALQRLFGISCELFWVDPTAVYDSSLSVFARNFLVVFAPKAKPHFDKARFVRLDVKRKHVFNLSCVCGDCAYSASDGSANYHITTEVAAASSRRNAKGTRVRIICAECPCLQAVGN